MRGVVAQNAYFARFKILKLLNAHFAPKFRHFCADFKFLELFGIILMLSFQRAQEEANWSRNGCVMTKNVNF